MSQPSEDATTEQRARAVQYWEEVIRPQMTAKETTAPKETPQAALERLKAEAGKPVAIGDGLAKILGTMKRDRAA